MTELIKQASIKNVPKSVPTEQFLTFQVGHDLYAINILLIKEIIHFPLLTSVSNAPPYILGIAPLYGQLVPLIDLRQLCQGGAPQDERSMVIMVHQEGKCYGLVVESVLDIVNLTADEIKSAPDFFETIPNAFIHQVGVKEGKVLMIFDVMQLIQSQSHHLKNLTEK